MKSGKYIRTKEWREKMSVLKKGNKNLLGFKFSKESKIKMSVSHKGQHSSPKTEFKKGIIPWSKGKKLSEEIRRNISIGHIGQKPSEKQIEGSRKRWLGENNPNYGKPMNSLLKARLIKIHTGRKHSLIERMKRSNSQKGEKGSNWKGGITKINSLIRNSLEIKLFREKVFKRDDFTCQKCKIKGGRLEVHHMLNFSSYDIFRSTVENGITFCKDHHKEFHSLYGRENNNIQQIEEFLGRSLHKEKEDTMSSF